MLVYNMNQESADVNGNDVKMFYNISALVFEALGMMNEMTSESDCGLNISSSIIATKKFFNQIKLSHDKALLASFGF